MFNVYLDLLDMAYFDSLDELGKNNCNRLLFIYYSEDCFLNVHLTCRSSVNCTRATGRFLYIYYRSNF